MNTNTPGVILHVDDEPSVRNTLALLLGTPGEEVHGAASGPEALHLASKGLQPDVLIVDFNLDQDMNGAEVAEQIRRVLHYTPPIIMLTGDLTNAEFPTITEVPVWLTRKPTNPQLLLAALPGLIGLSRATRPLLRR
jgi:two-component system CheB/CheR fusion protein